MKTKIQQTKRTEKEKNPFHCPKCSFSMTTCRDCDYFGSGSWCHKHETYTDPDKWPCSSFR